MTEDAVPYGLPPDDPLDRLTLLERAQLLHDATLRRHGELLDRHADEMTLLRQIQERQATLMEDLRGIAFRLEQTMAAIKDQLNRGNGHGRPRP